MSDRSPSDIDRPDIEPVDPDIALIGDYLARALPEAEAEAVEERMVHDEAFFTKISPILKVWSLPVGYRDRLARRKIAERRLPSLSKRARVLLAVAAVLVALVIPPAVRFISFLRHSDAIASGSGKLSSAKLESGAAAVTSVGETRVFALDDFSSILLRPGSRFFYKQAPGRPEVLASLEGEAEIIVSPTTHLMRLQTSVGSMVLMPGDYAVRCGAECEELLITVGRGTAILRASGSTPVVQIHAGEYGRFPRGGQPESTAGGDGYPILTSPPGDAP